jgi:hypothetical protein
MKPAGEHRVLRPNTLVLYVDDSGDERIGDRAYPVFAFGGVACVSDYMPTLINDWRAMKASVFPQVKTALHAKEHMKETRLKGVRRDSVLAAMGHPGLARFGIVFTDRTQVSRDRIVLSATATLAMRFDKIANGLVARELWKPGGDVLIIFEESRRLEKAIEGHLGQLTYEYGGAKFPIEKGFMPKYAADPFLEMADFVTYTIGRNSRHQAANGELSCTENFESLFRNVDPALASYMKAETVTFQAAA